MHPLLVFAIFISNACVWYLFVAFSYYINGGNLGRHRYWFPFQCLWEDIKMLRPGGAAHSIKEMVLESLRGGTVEGYLAGGKGWRYTELRDANDEQEWRACADAMYGSWLARFIEAIITISWPFWPLTLLHL